MPYLRPHWGGDGGVYSKTMLIHPSTPEHSSFLHRLDPRTKILLTILFTGVVFLLRRLGAAACLTGGLLLLCRAGGLPLGWIKARLRALGGLLLLLTLLQMLLGPGDHYLLRPLIPPGVPLIGGRLSLKWEGLLLGLLTGLRLTALLILLPLLLRTTSLKLLSLGLLRLGLPYRAAYTITTAINLIPSLEEEARVIREAQTLRGLSVFETGKRLDKLRAYPALAVPLLMIALRKAQVVGIAMDARAFGAYRTRTSLETLRMSPRDAAAFGVGSGFAALVLALNFML